MILGFKTKTDDGKPTLFPHKIINGLLRSTWIKCMDWTDIMLNEVNPFRDVVISGKVKPKIHTLRQDAGDRWKPGVMIDFFVGVRTKNSFRFAPRVPVVSVQSILIKYTRSSMGSPLIYIEIDCKCFDTWNFKHSAFGKIDKLAKNDGFDSLEEFFSWFNKDFTGKIIHWTPLKY